MATVRVRYKGLSDVREIRASDLKRHGIGIDQTLRWNRDNDFTVVVDGMSDKLEELLRAEGTFKVEEVNDKGEVQGKPIINATVFDDTMSQKVVDKTTGQTSKRQ